MAGCCWRSRREESVDVRWISSGQFVDESGDWSRGRSCARLVPRISAAQDLQQRFEIPADVRILGLELSDLAARMQHSSVVAPAESLADVGKAELRQLFGERHGHLARAGYVA